MYLDTTNNLRAGSELVAMLRASRDWQKVKTLCSALPRPVIERAAVRDAILQVYPTMSSLIAGDVANYTMDELIIN